jgi:hypothetical protein
MKEFNSQICTSREQSERLLALGLKKETADMCYTLLGGHDESVRTLYAKPCSYHNDIPAWSLGRLFALVNGVDWRAEITLKDERYGIHTGFDTMWYDDIFEAVIAWIEEDIKEGYFNEDYLQEQAGSSREE